MENMRLVPIGKIDDEETLYYMLQNIEKSENAFQNDVYGMSRYDFKLWIEKMMDWEKGINLPEGYVKQSIFILYADCIPLGIGKIRHQLTDFTRKNGGNVGYAIRKDYRGHGYGKILMRLLLSEANYIGVEEIIATVKTDNLPSQKAIEANGGICVGKENDFYIYCLKNKEK